MEARKFGRRDVLRGSAALALLGPGLTLLAACSRVASPPAATVQPGSPSTAVAGQTPPATGTTLGGLKLPTYVPFQGPQPDLTGNAQGLDPAYYKFPSDLVQSVSRPPGDGSTVTAITYLTTPPPPPLEQNAAWQSVNQALGVSLDLNQISGSDYVVKLPVILAGTELPDFIYNPTTTNPQGLIPALPQFVRARCADLTPFLSGDAVKQFPNLAHYSTYSWRSGVIDNKIFALPVARPPIGSVLMFRSDIFDKAGVHIDGAPSDAAEFKRMLQAVTIPQQNQYGMAAGSSPGFGLYSNSALLSVFNVPNNWRMEPGGNLIKDFESDQFKAAIAWCQDTWKAGLWHPNSPDYGGTFNDDLLGGRFAVAPGYWGQWVILWPLQHKANPDARLYPMHPFAADGSKPIYEAGSGNFGFTMLKQQTSPERVKLLLQVADFLAAPFGTTEWLQINYGVKDLDYTLDAQGSPVFTDRGRAELSTAWRTITSPAFALFDPNRSMEFADVSHAAEAAMMAAMEIDPTLGMYSETAFTQGIAAQNDLYGVAKDIVLGRRDWSEWDSAMSVWRTRAGDKMRAEFQDAIQKSGTQG